jgi:outer membrane receptor for ferrienterochelin and colicin
MSFVFSVRKTTLSILIGIIVHSGNVLAADNSDVLSLDNNDSGKEKVISAKKAEKPATNETDMIVSAKAENVLKQQPGASLITQQDLERNRDINTSLQWEINDQQYLDFNYAYSRQGNIYAGDTQYSLSNLSTLVPTLYGSETNRMYRQAYSLIHNGIWDWGQSKLTLSYEDTHNTRLAEGSTGKVEGMINSDTFNTSRYKTWRINNEYTVPFNLLVDHTLTIGGEWN